jgi:hypothetical protein
MCFFAPTYIWWAELRIAGKSGIILMTAFVPCRFAVIRGSKGFARAVKRPYKTAEPRHAPALIFQMQASEADGADD